MTAGRAALAALVLTCACHAAAAAQMVVGRVVHAGTERGLRDVAFRLTNDARQVVARFTSDSTGTFRVRAPTPGTFQLDAEFIGYQSVSSAIDIGIAEEVELLVSMDVAAVPLEPIAVRARTSYDIGPVAEFYQRLERQRRVGIGHFFTRDQIEASNLSAISELIRTLPRVSLANQRGRGNHILMQSVRGACTPQVYLDGMLSNRNDRAFIDEWVRADEVEGVEVYQGLARMPAEYMDQTGCGVVLVWTRRYRGEGGRPLTWRRALLAVGVLGGLILLTVR